MPFWLRALSVCSVMAAAVIRAALNDWEIPSELLSFIFVFGPHLVLALAALTAKRRGPCVAVLVAALASGLIGTPALRSARTFGEAGTPMTISVLFVELLAAIIILL